MFGIGLPEMIVILAIALIVVGPDKLPDVARSVAKGINELRKTVNQLKENLTEDTVISSVQEDLRKTADHIQGQLLTDESKIWRPPEDLHLQNPNDPITMEAEIDNEAEADQTADGRQEKASPSANQEEQDTSTETTASDSAAAVPRPQEFSDQSSGADNHPSPA